MRNRCAAILLIVIRRQPMIFRADKGLEECPGLARKLAQTVFLRKLARKTWAFFETFVGPEDHWLPPDNYQEYRGAAVAHRTSPTNMGLALLANLTAYDFGYIPAGQLIERTANTLRTMDTLARHRGPVSYTHLTLPTNRE